MKDMIEKLDALKAEIEEMDFKARRKAAREICPELHHADRHVPSLERIKEMHSWMNLENWIDEQDAMGHRPYGQSLDEQCYLCAVIACLERAWTEIDELKASLALYAATGRKNENEGAR